MRSACAGWAVAAVLAASELCGCNPRPDVIGNIVPATPRDAGMKDGGGGHAGRGHGGNPGNGGESGAGGTLGFDVSGAGYGNPFDPCTQVKFGFENLIKFVNCRAQNDAYVSLALQLFIAYAPPASDTDMDCFTQNGDQRVFRPFSVENGEIVVCGHYCTAITSWLNETQPRYADCKNRMSSQ